MVRNPLYADEIEATKGAGMELKEGAVYKFADLESEFGKDTSYAFVRNNCVTAFILQPEMNPTFKDGAPAQGRILVAKGSLRESVIKKLTHGRSYPVFVKQGTNKWLYVGLYTYDYVSDDPQDKEIHSREADIRLNEISHVIFLRRKAAAQAVVTTKKRAA